MNPKSPVVSNANVQETALAETQAQWSTLPAVRYLSNEGVVTLTRWQPSPEELELLVRGESVYLEVVGGGMPPVQVYCATEQEVLDRVTTPPDGQPLQVSEQTS